MDGGRRGRGPHRSALVLACALLAVLFALSVMSWSTVSDDGPGPDTAADGAGDGTDSGSGPDPDDKPGQQPSDEIAPQGNVGLSERFEPRERPSGRAALVANPLYDTGRLSPLPCPVPDLDVDDAGSMEVFLHAVADCLDDAWQTQFDRAGIPFAPPNRVFWEDAGVSPCRPYPSPAGAFYCRASASIYIGTSDVADKWNNASDSVVYASLLAHEYGHHVQGESGLLEYYHEQRRQEEDDPRRNAWTRRGELQANCLAGTFLGSVRVSYPLTGEDLDTLLSDAAATADREDGADDERTHGSMDNSVWWTRTGWEQQTPGACNTWETGDDELVQ